MVYKCIEMFAESFDTSVETLREFLKEKGFLQYSIHVTFGGLGETYETDAYHTNHFRGFRRWIGDRESIISETGNEETNLSTSYEESEVLGVDSILPVTRPSFLDYGVFSDDQLIKMIPDDSKAFDELAERYRPLRESIYRTLRADFDKEDLDQNFLLSLYTKILDGKIAITGAFERYLYVMVRNFMLDELRRLKRTPTTISLSRLVAEGKSGDVIKIDLESSDIGPLEKIDKKERISALRKVLDELEDQDRLLLELRGLNIPHDEIAEELGISHVATRKRYERILGRVRQEICKNPEYIQLVG